MRTNRICALMAALACLGMAADLQSVKKPASRRLSFTGMPLSFEPNLGQSDPSARFIAKSPGYTLRLESTGARFEFPGRDKVSASLRMDLEKANRQAAIAGESLLLGKDDYFPTKDPKTWFTNIPTYARVRYRAVYPGVDLAFYGNANRLEYDFLLNPGADPATIRMKLSGADQASVDAAGDLLLRLGKGEMRFLKPVAYQRSADGKRREPVQARYKLERNASGEPVLVSFSIGSYDRARPLVIDPVAVPSLVYSQYLSGWAAAVTVDSSGNTYVTGQSYDGYNGFYVTKFNSSGAVVYNANVGAGRPNPYAIAVDSSTGQAYVAGEIYSGATLPTSANAYQSTATDYYNGFLAVISADGSAVPYATYLGGTDSNPYGYSYAYGVAVDSSGNAYLTGYTNSATFPISSGAYLATFSTEYGQDGFVTKINPAAATGPASLVYSTFLGPGASLYGIAVDSSGDAYVTGNAPSGFPVTSGAFQYSGVESTSGGVYVTKLNTTGTALVYSAYLGDGTGYGITVEGQSSPSAYVTGTVGYADFPTTAGAYQTSYAGGFVTKLNSTGSSEVYSTFLGGPSSYASNGNVSPASIALLNGCSSSCNAYIAGWTSTTDFPMIDAVGTTPSTTGYSAFVTEIAANGASALFSSYLNGINSGVYPPNNDGPQFGLAPSIAIDSSGNMLVVGNTYGTSDFPITISNANPTYAFLAKIGLTTTPFTLATPASVNFGNQPVGVSTSVSGGTATVRLNNYSATATTVSIAVSPTSVFSESDNCGGSIAGGGSCTLSLNFTPNAPSARTGTVTVTSNASDSPTIITVTGTGQDQPFAQPSTSSLTFAPQTVGTSSTQAITVTNQGTETTPISFSLGTSDFSELDNCPSQLAPGASCTVNITFSPTQSGLRTDSLEIIAPGQSYPSVSLSGTGTVSGVTAAVTLSSTAIAFGPQTVGTAAVNQQYVYITNTGSEPVTLQSIAASGDYTVGSTNCSPLPSQLNPQASCYAYVNFAPTTTGTRTGTLAFSDTATGSPQTVALSGTGVASTENVEFNPSSAVSFPDTPVASTSGIQTIYLYNTGSSTITVDRVEVSGAGFSISATNCEATTIPGVLPDGTGGGSSCYVNVQFTPTATGSQTGTLTFIDSAPGSPHVVNLTGNGITATGTISLEPNAVNFNTQAVGTTSSDQLVYLVNPGNTPVTITALSFSGTAAGDYSVDYSNSNCGSLPYSVAAGQSNCYIGIQFTPTTTGTRTATLTVADSAGNQTASLTGTGLAASQAIGLTPTSMNLGSIVVGQGGANEYVYIRNTGTEPVTFSADPAVTGTNAADFTTTNYCATNGSSLAGGASCYIYVQFTPSVATAESATLTFTDSAGTGTQTLALSGTGVSSTPTYTLSDYLISYNTQVQGTTSPLNTYIYFYNNGANPVNLGNVGITGPFLIPPGSNSCNGQTIAAGSSCYVYVEFAPTSAGYLTGTLTFNNNSGTALTGVPTVPLAGFAVAQTYTAYINPTSLNFAQPVIGNTSSSQTITLYNTGNTSLTVGSVTGTNLGLAGSTDEFSIYGANGGSDGCSGQPVAAGGSCSVNVTFTPNAAGAQAGTISFPVMYSNSTTATFTANLSGTGVAEKNSAVLTPPNLSFLDQGVGATSGSSTVYLNNNGNQPFTVGALTNTNTTEFSTASSNGGNDGCSGSTVPAGGNCQINVTFIPSATGARTGSITFPVTFADKTTASPKLTLTGTGVTSAKTVQITPGNIQFPAEMQSNTAGYQTITVTNTGNQPVTIGADSISTNSAEFSIYQDSCTGTNLTPNQSCNINVTFTPGASSTGTRTGALKIGDNATGGPHTVALSGTAITASQQIVVSPTTLAFGNQPAGSTSSAQVVYFSNQSDSNVTINSIALGGTNAADFQISNNTCYYGYFPARGSCSVSVQFVPPTGVTGALTASIAESDGATPGTHTITLTGTAVTPGPAVAFSPSTLTFATQNVGSSSAAQSFSVTNTGSANLTITAVASTNATEFPVYSDGCSGTTLTPGQHCLIGVQFSPSLGGTRTGTIKVTDNATGSPQSLAVTGTGYGIPSTSFTPASLTFGSTNIGATSATQTITLKNPGTDTLLITSVAITGVHAGDYAQTNTCPASLAPSATCVITVSFKPTAAGTRAASITVTDNANNAPGSTQNAALTGTGVAVPTAGVAPTTLTFSSTDIGVTSAAQTATLTNSGSGPLTITSIAISGTNAADYSETNSCGATLVAGSNCTISVTFKPAAAGTRTATITITDNANNTSGATQTVALTGTGAGLSGAGLSPSSLTFTDQNVGTTSAAQSLTLTNSGTGALTIASIAIGGANAGDFAQTNTCGTSVAAGSNCAISITFKPTGTSSRTATVTVTDNAGNVTGSTQTASLSGTGIGVPVAGVAPASLSFAATPVGSTTAAQTVTLSNSGTGPLTISSIVIGGTNPGDFAQTNTCGTSVAAGGSCAISVTFTPAAVGARTANLHVIDNSGNTGSTQSVTLTGTGSAVAGQPSVVSVSPNPATGLSNTFALEYSDTAGNASLNHVLVIFNSAVSTANSCYAAYYPATNQLYLENDGGTGSTPITPGSGTLSNSQCTIGGSGTSVTSSGNTLTLNLNVTASSTYTGKQNVYLEAVDNSKVSTGWVNKGTWTPAANQAPTAVSVSPNPATGLSNTFALQYSDANGALDLNHVSVIFNSTTGTANSCYAAYYPATNQLYLENDGGTGSTPITPGSGTLSNSQCTIGGSGTSVTSSGNTLTLNLNVTASSTYTGKQNVYLEAVDNSKVSTGWVNKGTWTPAANQAPTAVSVSPNPATGLSNTFALQYSDANGALDLNHVSVIFNSTTGTANSCYAAYYPATNQLYLENDGGTGSTPITPGSGTLSNSQCTIGGSGTSVTRSGDTLTLNLDVTASSTYTGKQDVYLEAVDNSSANSGWVNKGTWTPAANQAPTAVSVSPNPATGLSNTFALQYSDANGALDLNHVSVIFNSTTGTANSCYAAYYPATNQLYLENDGGTGSTPITPGSGTLSNSQCTIGGSGTSVTRSGDTLTLNLDVTASSTYTGKQDVYLEAVDNSSANSGWVNKGTWTPAANQAPTAVSVSPNPATGLSNTFALQYSDANGALDLNHVSVIFNSTTGTANSCYAAYYPATNQLYLENDGGTGSTPITPGSGTLSNSQCTIGGSGTSVTRSGDTLTLNLDVTASSTYTGTKNIFMYADDNSSANTGWVNKGTWTP